MGMSKKDRKTISTGVNYASGSSGLLPQNGHVLHKNVINFFQQVDLFENSTMKDLKGTFDSPKRLKKYLSKSLFFIHHASNDLGVTFEIEMKKKYSIDTYVKLLIKELSKQLQALNSFMEIFTKFFKMCLNHLNLMVRFKDVNSSCCIDKNGTRIQVCAPNIDPCEDRKTRVFFDPFHPSEAMHFLWARRFLKDSSICSPINLIQLMQA
ncbi:hypothetical protein Goshw_012392 [Gossypium schwendimanii]|uniref:Uncharacterized protein n=1 Tax=Gossypium schwendimanii TaxID=34291 RepID=A0A7J9LFJ5_GOSSC|nr:hypothetical protein [Gossypium schwendimanii]